MNGSGFRATVGVVLAGTHPWNDTPFDRLLPRPLLPIAHRPLISYALSWLSDGGVSDAVLCINRETRNLQSRVAPHIPAGMRPIYHEDQMPRGSAGCVRDALNGHDTETLVVAD